MTLQTSGRISLLDIVGEFDGTSPHNLTEYYGADTGVPSSGRISLFDFYGKSAIQNIFYITSTSINDTMYGKPALAGQSKVNLEFAMTDSVGDVYSMRIKNLGVNQANVTAGTGNIFQLTPSQWESNGTLAYIWEDHNKTIEQIFSPGVDKPSGSPTSMNGTFTQSAGQSITDVNNKKYVFEVLSRTSVTIDLTSTIDVYLHLLNDDGDRIAYDDDSGSGRDSKITIILDPGVYYIVAATYSPNKVGSFTVSISGGTNLTKARDGYVQDKNGKYKHRLIINDTLNWFYPTPSYVAPSVGYGYMYNSIYAMRARSAGFNIEPNSGFLTFSDLLTSGSSSTFSDWCSASLGYDGKHWYRVFGPSFRVKSRCWTGSSSNENEILSKNDFVEYIVTEF